MKRGAGAEEEHQQEGEGGAEEERVGEGEEEEDQQQPRHQAASSHGPHQRPLPGRLPRARSGRPRQAAGDETDAPESLLIPYCIMQIQIRTWQFSSIQ